MKDMGSQVTGWAMPLMHTCLQVRLGGSDSQRVRERRCGISGMATATGGSSTGSGLD